MDRALQTWYKTRRKVQNTDFLPSDHGASREWYFGAIMYCAWLSPKMAGIGQVVLEVRAVIVWYINSPFLAKFRFPVTREDVTLLKTFTITKLLDRETELSSPERPREL